MRMEMQMTNRQRMFRHELESSKREVRGMFFRGGWLRPATRQRVRAVARQMAREAMRRVRKQAAEDLGMVVANGD